ncbi:MAG TPA: asparaginase [Gemmatimonadota bacterium]|nr:asparaginase [Gemmatimonadota bacterium]
MGDPSDIDGVRLWRGDEIESLHAVTAAVVDEHGLLVARHGDPSRRAFLRSSAKPIQLLPVVEDGLIERYGFTPEELAVMAASHNAEPVHLAAVRSILGKADLDEAMLQCGPHEPIGRAAAEELQRTGERPTAIHNNCSGKHAGMLAVCRARGWSLETYREPGHPLQLRIWRLLAELADLDATAIGRAVDGCGVVVFALPVEGMARAWASLAAGDARRGDDRERAIGRIFDAMAAYPDMVGGSGRLDTDLLRRCGDRLIVKTGAEGVFCAALRRRAGDDPLGMALKVVDGAGRAQDVALMALIEGLGVVAPGDDAALDAHARPEVRNRSGAVVGRIDARLPLERVGA